jgi:hypothetical protein
MKSSMRLLLGLSLLLGCMSFVTAQDKSEGMGMTTPPPKVVVIYREFLKPGKNGATHEKSESAFVQAMTRAKWPTHYFAVDALSGRPRSLFLTPYDSFEAWEKDNQAVQKNATLSAALDKAAVVDGELLSEADASVLTYNEEQSLRPAVDIAHMRYFEISLYRVRPGHRRDWNALVKLVTAAYEKIPDAHWATYEAAYGQEGATYVIFVPMKSAVEIDHAFAQDKDFVAAMGEEGMKKLSELESATIEFSQTNLFLFNPKMSYPPDAWVKADPDFWKPKPAMAAPIVPKKAAEKPAGGQ